MKQPAEIDGKDDNILSRLRNSLVRANNAQILLPKFILVILDDDIMDAIDHYKTSISYGIGQMLEWLINEFHKLVSSHKERLPTKSQKYKYPTFIWVKIPYHEIYGHCNEFKEKFNAALDKACRLFKEMKTIEIDQRTWRHRGLSYFEEGRISNIGLNLYWQSICNSFETWDRQEMSATITSKFQTQNYNPSYNRKISKPEEHRRAFPNSSNQSNKKWKDLNLPCDRILPRHPHNPKY